MEKALCKIKISPMKKSDVDAVLAIEADAYGDHHWSRDSFLNELSNELAFYFSAFGEDDKLVGYAGCWQILEEAHITTVAVAPEHLRKHIGEALLVRLLDCCYENKIKYITLEVRVSNVPAIKLYEKYGFKQLGTRKGYYQNNNEDALIMWTENIFYDQFKTEYQKNVEALKGKISVS